MTHAATPDLCEATAIRILNFSTYPANRVTQLQLQHWQDQALPGEQRAVEPMHDCLAALHAVVVADASAMAPCDWTRPSADPQAAPTESRFGTTRVILVSLPDELETDTHVRQDILQAAVGDAAARAAQTLPDGSRLVCGDDATWVLVGRSRDIESCLAFARGPLRLVETLRHKVQGQFVEYETAFRQPYLDAIRTLRAGLQRLHTSWEGVRSPGERTARDSSTAVRESHRVTQDYTAALLAQGPVRQIETMLAANLKNLSRAVATLMPGGTAGLFESRESSLEMLLAQVRADVESARPMLEAAHSVTQSFHTQLLADLASVEARENQQRAVESTRRDGQTRTLTLLGLWIGMNQLTNGWLSLPDTVTHGRPESLVAWLALPTLVTGTLWLVFQGMFSMFVQGTSRDVQRD